MQNESTQTKTRIGEFLRVIILGGVLASTIGLSLAEWQPPTQLPPGGNTPPPIHIGSASQTKAGGILAQFFAGTGGSFGSIGVGKPYVSAPAGGISAVGDICTDIPLGTGTCLSTVGGGGPIFPAIKPETGTLNTTGTTNIPGVHSFCAITRITSSGSTDSVSPTCYVDNYGCSLTTGKCQWRVIVTQGGGANGIPGCRATCID